MHKYMKVGKRKGISLLTGPGGNFGPAGARAGSPAWPASGGRRGDGTVGTGPRVRGRRGVTVSGGKGRSAAMRTGRQ
jgi:hypothetical protein